MYNSVINIKGEIIRIWIGITMIKFNNLNSLDLVIKEISFLKLDRNANI